MNDGMVFILVAAGALAGAVFGARRRPIAPPRGRDLWIPASLWALAVAFVGVVMWIGIALLGQTANRDHFFVRRPVGEIHITQSADPSAVAPWTVPRGFAGTELQVAPAPGRRGADGALRMTVDLRGPADTAAAQVPGAVLPDDIAVASAWVYVEDTEAARTGDLHARLVSRMRAGSGGSFSLFGERIALTPGAWTEVVWAGSYTLSLSPALGGDSSAERKVRASERLTSLGVRLEADQPFRGSVFVDDLRFYAAEAAPRSGPR